MAVLWVTSGAGAILLDDGVVEATLEVAVVVCVSLCASPLLLLELEDVSACTEEATIEVFDIVLKVFVEVSVECEDGPEDADEIVWVVDAVTTELSVEGSPSTVELVVLSHVVLEASEAITVVVVVHPL